jgi:hypothetical protein
MHSKHGVSGTCSSGPTSTGGGKVNGYVRAYATHPDEIDRHPGELVLGMPRDTEHAVVEFVTTVPIGPLPRRDLHTGLFEIRDKCLRLRPTPSWSAV